MTKAKKLKTRNRYSIGEWYGAGFESLSAAERFQRAKAECEANAILGVACPFQSDAKCNKKGGVCSLRKYQQIVDLLKYLLSVNFESRGRLLCIALDRMSNPPYV